MESERLFAIVGWNMFTAAPGEALLKYTPFGITTSIGWALPSAMRLSMIWAVRPRSSQASSSPPEPCRRYNTGYFALGLSS